MSNSVSSVDNLSMEMINESVLINIDDLDEQEANHQVSPVLDSRRRLERCLEDRQLAKDLREFDFDI